MVRWRQSQTVASVTTPDGVYVLQVDSENPTPVLISGSGLRIWECLVVWSTVEEIVGAITSAFGVEHEAARLQITSYLGELESRLLVERE